MTPYHLYTGIFRATRLRLNPRQRAAHALFKTYLDVVHVGKDETDKLFRPRTGGVGIMGTVSVCFCFGDTMHVLSVTAQHTKGTFKQPPPLLACCRVPWEAIGLE